MSTYILSGGSSKIQHARNHNNDQNGEKSEVLGTLVGHDSERDDYNH